MSSEVGHKPLTLGYLRKCLEIWPEEWDKYEIRVFWGGLGMSTSEVVCLDTAKVRNDTNAMDHDAKREESRVCFCLSAENPTKKE